MKLIMWHNLQDVWADPAHHQHCYISGISFIFICDYGLSGFCTLSSYIKLLNIDMNFHLVNYKIPMLIKWSSFYQEWMLIHNWSFKDSFDIKIFCHQGCHITDIEYAWSIGPAWVFAISASTSTWSMIIDHQNCHN